MIWWFTERLSAATIFFRITVSLLWKNLGPPLFLSVFCSFSQCWAIWILGEFIQTFTPGKTGDCHECFPQEWWISNCLEMAWKPFLDYSKNFWHNFTYLQVGRRCVERMKKITTSGFSYFGWLFIIENVTFSLVFNSFCVSFSLLGMEGICQKKIVWKSVQLLQ